MHRWLTVLLTLLAATVVLLGVRPWREALSVDRGDAVQLLLIENPLLIDDGREVLVAYESVLQEEGVPWRRLTQRNLLDIDPQRLAERCPGLVFLESVNTIGLTPLTRWLHAYMGAGGHVLLVYDAGSRSARGANRIEGGLRELLDLGSETADKTGGNRFGWGAVRFLHAETASILGIPPGKLNQQRQLTGYGIGVLEYPLAIARPRQVDDSFMVLAWGENQEGPGGPVILERKVGAGGLLYVGMPLGYLKGQSDDLPLRLVLRHFVDRRARLPRVLPVPRGVGGLVVNWHVDAKADLRAWPRMAAAGFLDPALSASWHVTAGPDNDETKDGGGFDACGQGRSLLERLPAGSELGSHGGWAHNYFAHRLADGRMSLDEARALITKNRDCLAAIAGRPLREYSSPAGVHPQPGLTDLIEQLGFGCYYYTGDGGSAPNRTFYDGVPVSSRLIAFPVLPLGGNASLGEFIADPQTTPDDLAGWLDAVASYCAAERTIRLVYAHPYDLFDLAGATAYRKAWLAWQRDLVRRQGEGDLQVRTMGDFAEFLDRAWRTETKFRRTSEGMRISLRNAGGLQDITVAVPRMGLAPPDDMRIWVTEDADRYYLTIEDTGHALDLLLPRR